VAPRERSSGIGLMGGTFDPIHLAHLVTAEATVEQFGLERVIFVPTRQPPHKQGHPITPAEHRYNMVVLATRSNSRFEVSRIELEREGPSYTVDTLEEMRAHLGAGVELYFITGADAILDIGTWRDPERLFKLCRFVAARRPGFSAQAIREGLTRLERRYGCRILEVDAPSLEISSTDIRLRVRESRSIKYLVPGGVEDYIYRNGLYRGGFGSDGTV